MYGVPIPMAYLLNETRVRNVIIHSGWVEGFKALFHSDEKIKQMKRERILSFLHPSETNPFSGIFSMKRLSKKVKSDLQKRVEYISDNKTIKTKPQTLKWNDESCETMNNVAAQENNVAIEVQSNILFDGDNLCDVRGKSMEDSDVDVTKIVIYP